MNDSKVKLKSYVKTLKRTPSAIQLVLVLKARIILFFQDILHFYNRFFQNRKMQVAGFEGRKMV